MLCYDHFFGAYRNIYLDYDYLHTVNGHDELPVRFTRLNTSGEHDTAETIVPSCNSWETHGFTENELDALKTFLANNMEALLAEAEQTRDGDAHLTTMTFELPYTLQLRLLAMSYLSGIAPGAFIRNAIRDFARAIDAGEIDPTDYLKDGAKDEQR